MTDINHGVSKQIVEKDYAYFALEDLSGIRTQISRGKKVNGMLNSWAFYQLEQFIKYKAEDEGKHILKIDARYTSQKCSKCGNIKKTNRKGSDFKCNSCGCELHADLNASRNIAQNGISVLSRLSVNQPNATPMVVASPRALAVGN